MFVWATDVLVERVPLLAFLSVAISYSRTRIHKLHRTCPSKSEFPSLALCRICFFLYIVDFLLTSV